MVETNFDVKQLREITGQHASSSSWQNVGTLVGANSQFNGINKRLKDVVVSVPESAAVDVLVALTLGSSAPTSDIVSNTVAAGQSRFYSRVNLDNVWIKSATASVFEWCGVPE